MVTRMGKCQDRSVGRIPPRLVHHNLEVQPGIVDLFGFWIVLPSRRPQQVFNSLRVRAVLTLSFLVTLCSLTTEVSFMVIVLPHS